MKSWYAALFRRAARHGPPPPADPPGWPAGHFYSPIPDLADIRAREAEVFRIERREIDGVDLNDRTQLELVEALAPYHDAQPFHARKRPGLRYYFENDYYSYGEALILFSMLLHLRPRQVMEVGSGFSTAVLLDTNQRFLGGEVHCTLIEPFPERLLALMETGDREAVDLLKLPVQRVPTSRFAELEANDILFIDSTHVSKIDSDVNHLLFRILPRLASGVYVHLHDIYFPFEYPREWIYQGRAWNEAYLVRAFLQYNEAFEIVLFNSYLGRFYADWMRSRMPLFMLGPGSSLWIRRR